MGRNKLEPFDGLSVITTETDEIEVAHLLKQNTNLSLICQDCGGKRFEVEGFIPVGLNILAENHIVVSHIDYEKIVVNRISKCSHCGGVDFVTLTNSEKKDGQKQSGTG